MVAACVGLHTPNRRGPFLPSKLQFSVDLIQTSFSIKYSHTTDRLSSLFITIIISPDEQKRFYQQLNIGSKLNLINLLYQSIGFL